MPPKKKRTSKKKNKQAAAQASHGSSMDKKETSARLKSGEEDPSDVAFRLASDGKVTDAFEDEDTESEGPRALEILLLALATHAFTTDRQVPPGLVEKFAKEMGAKVFEKGAFDDSIPEDSERGEFMTGIIFESYNELAKTWEDTIRHCTGRSDVPILSFREFSEILAKPMRTAEFKESIEKGDQDEKLEALQVIQNSYNAIKLTCWECGKQNAKTKKCSRCKAARYCSVECQRKSWKDGHNRACSKLGGMYKSFKNDQDQVDQAMELGIKGIKPCPCFDYSQLCVLHSDEKGGFANIFQPIEELGLIPSLQGPSMSIFYQNLTQLVSDGSHWLLSNAKDAIVETEEKERIAFLTVSALFCYDISAVSSIETFKKICWKLAGNMTAKRYIHLYSTTNERMDQGDISMEQAKFECFVKCFKHFREQHLK